MFEYPSLGEILVTALAVWLAYWTYKIDKKEAKIRAEKKEQERVLLEGVIYLTTTRVKFERHLWTILDKVAAYKLQNVVITDEKEIPQSVLLPYAEYKLLQECYDQKEAIELAPLLEERLNNAQGNTVSHEEMMQRISEKRAKQKIQSKEANDHD